MNKYDKQHQLAYDIWLADNKSEYAYCLNQLNKVHSDFAEAEIDLLVKRGIVSARQLNTLIDFLKADLIDYFKRLIKKSL